jgi:putative oxidoreductase
MTDTPIAMQSQPGVAGLILRANALMAAIPYWLIALVARLSIAGVFWRSGQTKVEGWHITDATLFLFKDEYKLPLIDPTLAAYLATFAEHFFPVLLVIGFATRFAALSLLIMTLVIQIFVYPEAWPTHGTWAACFLILMAQGPGKLSLDHLIAQRYR